MPNPSAIGREPCQTQAPWVGGTTPDPNNLGLATILSQNTHAKPKCHGFSNHVISKLLESKKHVKPMLCRLGKNCNEQALIFIWISLLLSWLCINPFTS